jgi:hypothetical protein
LRLRSESLELLFLLSERLIRRGLPCWPSVVTYNRLLFPRSILSMLCLLRDTARHGAMCL